MGARLPVRPLVILVLAVLLVPSAPAAPGPDGCHLYALHVPPGPAVDALFGDIDLEVRERFDVADTVLACGPLAAVPLAAHHPAVAGVYPVEALERHLADSREIVRVTAVDAPPEELGDGVTIAIVDSGVDTGHPALAGALKAAVRFSSTGREEGGNNADPHGTHVAGILVGDGTGSRDARQRGVAPGAGLVSLDISASFTTTNALRAFEWVHDHHAEYDIRVVTNSWGRERADARWDPDDPLVRASSSLVSDGLVVVFSAGNRGGDASLTVEAMNPDVITVGATDKHGDVAPYSSRGPAVGEDGRALDWVKPDVVAPGTRIVSTRANPTADGEGGYYTLMNGTSMAAPHAAGAAAVLLTARPDLAPSAVQLILRESAHDLGRNGPDDLYGYGMLDVGTAVRLATSETREKVLVREEVRRAVHAEGEALTGGGRFFSPPPAAPGSGEPALLVPLADAGAARVDVLLTWEASRVRPSVTVTDGTHELGPFPLVAGAASVRADLPKGGPWRLRVAVDDGVDRVAWAVDGYAVHVEERLVEKGGVYRTWETTPRGPDGFFEEHGRGGVLTNLVGPWGATRNLQIAAGLAVSGLVVGRWRRLGPEEAAALGATVHGNGRKGEEPARPEE